MKSNKRLGKTGTLILKVAAVLGIGLVYGTVVSNIVSADSLHGAGVSAGVHIAVSSGDSTPTCSANPSHLPNIISKGDQEIERRLTTLGSLTTKINSSSHLTVSDKATLSSEVSTTITGLTTLKSQLDSATTVCAAVTDAQSIYTEYRVYALVAPKVELIKVADDQLTVQSNLSALSVKLQARITADQNAGKNVTALQAELNAMNGLVSSAGTISSQIESSVINLQPSDYNSNHSVLVGDSAQLKIAHGDDQTAYNDAKTIVADLKSLS